MCELTINLLAKEYYEKLSLVASYIDDLEYEIEKGNNEGALKIIEKIKKQLEIDGE